MITVFGGQTSRSLRVVWVMEEMGLPYRVRQVDMLDGVKDDVEFLAVNPAVYIPAIQDGDVTMVESVAIMEYLATLMMVPVVSRFLAPETERHNWGAEWALECVERRLRLVARQLAHAPYLAGEAFTAADISVTYALELGAKHCGIVLGDAEQAYVARTTGRDAYKRALERSQPEAAQA